MKILPLLFLPLTFLLPSCRAKKTLPPPATTKCKLDYKSAKTLTGLLKKSQADFSTLQAKIKTKAMIDDKETDFTVSVRMKKDSVIWASVSPALGIEVIRFIATKDTIKFFDRINKTYYAGVYDTLSQLLRADVDLEVLQAFLSGNAVEFYEEDERLRAGIDSCRYLLATIRKRKLRKVIAKGKELREPAQSIWLTEGTFKVSRLLFKEFETRRELDVRFFNHKFAETSGTDSSNHQSVLIPHNSVFYIKTNQTITVFMEYSKVFANKPQSYPFSIPDGYTRIK